MKWFRQTLRNNRVFLLTVLAVNFFYMVEGVRFVEARQLRLQEEERHLEEFYAVFGIPMEKLRGDGESVFEPIKKLVVDGAGSSFEAGFDRLQKIVRQRKDQAVSHLSQAQERVGELISTTRRSLTSGPQVQIAAAFPQESPSPIQASGKERVSRAPRSRERSASSVGAGGMPLPLRRVEMKVRTEEAVAPAGPRAKSTVRIPSPVPREVIPKDGIAPGIVALAESLGNSPAKIFSRIHDSIDFDPKWGVHRSPLGTLHEGKGTAWDQAWLLQQLLSAAGVDARFQWGEIEIPTEILLNLTGVEDPWQAGNLMTTAGVPIVLVVQGSQVLSVRISHVWLTAYIDFIPNRGITPGPGDYWVRMDPTFKRFAIADGVRLDDQVPFDLGEYLESGTPFSPRQVYEEALQAHIADNNLGITLEEVKPSKTVIQDAFPFVPGSLRGRILTFEGESPEVPEAFQQHLDLEIRDAAGSVLATWATPWSAVGGKRLEVAWPGATVADQAALDLYGGVFATPPYEVDLKPVIRVDGVEVAAGGAIGSAEDVVLLATITPPQGSPTVMQFELLAGEHGVFTVDFGQMPQEVIDHYTQELSAATDPLEQEAWTLALAGALYHRLLSSDLEHLAGLRWQRLVQLGTAVLAVQRGAVSEPADGTPLVFSKGPMSLDLGAMPLGLFPASGAAGSTVSTLELLGSQGSFLEGEALSQVIGGEQITAVTFLTRAVREGQTLTLVDAGNVDAALAGAELSAEAEAHVRAGLAQGKIAWITESQLPVDTWQTSGYILEDPDTGAAGYFVTFERLVEGMEANIVFHSPQDLDVVTAPIDVVATIDAEGLESWTLSSRRSGEGVSQVIATGTGPVENSLLGQFDPTLLFNGMHDLVLTGTDLAGQTVTGKITVVVEGSMKIGHFTLSFVDLSIPVSGLDVEVIRTYDSRDKESHDFGYGWTLDVRQGSYRNNRPPGEGWQMPTPDGPLAIPCQTLETKSHLTTIRLSDREIYRFALKVRNGTPSTGGGCYAVASFDYVDGPVPGAKLEILESSNVFWVVGTDEVLDLDTLDTFEPQGVRLTTRDLRVFDLDLDFGVTRIEDSNGNQLTITPEGIFHSDEVGAEFVRDAEGRIVSIADPLGKEIRYEYDHRGDLIKTTNQADHVTQFVYDDGHRLEEIIDPRGVQAVRNDFDPDGRLIKVTDASGHSIDLQHDLANRREVMTNRLGFAKTFEYDDRGNVLVETDAEGQTITRTYDSKDRLLTVKDDLGYVTSITYDGDGNLTSVQDPLGNTTRFTYDPRGNVLTIVDPLDKTTTNTYSPSGNRLTTRDPLGNETSFAYDDSGNLTSETNATGVTTTFVRDGRGNPTRIIDPLGNEASFIYDAVGNETSQTVTRTLPDGSTETLTTTFTIDDMGRRVTTTLPDGSSLRTTYDPLGAVLSTEDEMGRVTRFTYDLLGRQTGTLYPDDITESRTYDPEGRLLTITDRSSRATSFVYDKVGRLLTTNLPDGSTTSSTYDAVGRLLSSTNPRGVTTTYTYDKAGRRIEALDVLGNRTQFEYDAAGNQVAVHDALGRVTRFEYDDAGRLSKTILPDGQETRLEYDALGSRAAEINQEGVRIEFGYDAAGRLIQITDALGGITRFTYDEVGNLLSRIDANGHETRFEYDQLGRQIARILPGGTRESFVYDAGGRRIRHTDFNGSTTQYTYDDNDRLIRRSYPDGATVDFAYTPNGRRSAVTDARGTTTYEYDDRARLISQTVPEGYELRYSWDAAGNRTAIAAELAGGTTIGLSYTYDLLDRIQTVTDSRGGVYTYAYDAVGNRQSLSYPNGVVTTYAYDDAHRLLEIRTENSENAVIQSHTYQRGATGNRQAVTEWDGTLRTYSYDLAYRLIQERVVDGDGSLVYQNKFTYDAIGNRLGQERTAADGSIESISYSYDERDRLLSEVSGLRDVAYGWDANGNQVAKSGTGADGAELGTTYSWAYEDRLVGVERVDGTTVAHRYDFDGVWMGRVVSGGSDPGEIGDRGWVVDQAGVLSQVIGQVDGTGVLEAEFTRATEFLGFLQAGAERYAHSDQIGSVVALTDSSADVLNRYTYDTFGGIRDTPPGVRSPFEFAGEQRVDPAGLYYLRARWFDPEGGSFLSVDPLAHQPNLLRYMPYSYADQDPINRIDPSGMSTAGVVAIGISAAVAVGLAAAFFIHPGRISMMGSKVKKIRPMILVDTNWPWLDSDVNMLLSHGRNLLSEQAALSYTWNPGKIRRLRNYEVTGNVDGRRHIISPNVETRAAADHLLYYLWLEDPKTYPVVFVTGLNFEPLAYGYTRGEGTITGWRGSLITKAGLRNAPELIVAHEFVHGFGLIGGHICVPGYLMSFPVCGRGRKLTSGQVTAVWVNSVTLR